MKNPVDLRLGDFSDRSIFEEGKVLCPSCGNPDMHLGLVTVIQGKERYTIGNKLAIQVESAEGGARGSIIVMNFLCEHSHYSQLEFQFHKGATFLRSRVLRKLRRNDKAWSTELWRD